jgi:surface antigen
MKNAYLLLRFTQSARTEIKIAILTVLIILCLPVMAVFALGASTLSFLSGGGGTTTAISTQTVGLYEGPPSSSDTYAWGNCTYWVFLLRQQAGDPIPTTWGNAATWAPRAQADSYLVDHNPAVGSIMQISTVDNGLGHVAYVTTADPISGAWTISEMNVQGLDIIDLKTYPASAAADFNFIHDKEPAL